MKQILLITIALLIYENVIWSLTTISQQRYLVLFNVNDRRLQNKSPALSIFSIISGWVSILLQMLQLKLFFLAEVTAISEILTITVILYGIVTSYLYFFISSYLNIPNKNMPYISKLILYIFAKIGHYRVNSYYRYENDNEKSLLINFLDLTSDMMQVKDVDNRYTYVNRALCDVIFKIPRRETLGRSTLEIGVELRKRGKKFTFGEVCSESDSVTKARMRPCLFYEYGWVGEEQIAVQVLKSPIQKNDKVVGTIGMARNVTTLIKQQNEIERLFEKGDIDEGISKFLAYHQQFKSLKNIDLKR